MRVFTVSSNKPTYRKHLNVGEEEDGGWMKYSSSRR